LIEESLDVPDNPGQQLCFLSAAESSDTAERLRLLESL
jgi:hypothetical protein